MRASSDSQPIPTLGPSTQRSIHRHMHTIQFHPSRRIAPIECLPGSVLIQSLGPFLSGDEMLRLGFSSGRIMNSLHPDFSSAPYHYTPPELWCMQVVIAHPDYKRPFAEVIIKHYSTQQAAEDGVMRLKRQWMDFDSFRYAYKDDHGGAVTKADYKDPIKFEHYFKKRCKNYYGSGEYMDQPPFDVRIWRLQPEAEKDASEEDELDEEVEDEEDESEDVEEEEEEDEEEDDIE